MRISVDRGKCETLGMCEAMASSYFEIDDDDEMRIIDDRPAPEDLAMVNAAVQSCPVLALTLSE